MIQDSTNSAGQSYIDSVNEQNLISYLSAFGDAVHANAREKGWWEKPREFPELVALMHSELSEALEAYRAGDPPDDKIPEFSGMTAELGDCIIRILDFCHAKGLPIEEALIAKHKFNKTREYRHGGKKA